MDATPLERNHSPNAPDSGHHLFDDVYDYATKRPSGFAIGGLVATAAMVMIGKGRYVPLALLGVLGTDFAFYEENKDSGGKNGSASPEQQAKNSARQSQPNAGQADNTGRQAKPDNTGRVNAPQQQPGLELAAMPQNGGNGPGDPVLHGDPNRKPAPYPGGNGPDAAELGQLMRATGPYPDYMNQLFLHTYNSRANENWLPANLPLHEISPEAKPKIAQWHLMSDSDLYTRAPNLGNRDMKPIADALSAGSSKNPGHMYAFGVDRNGLPVDVLEYYRDTHGAVNYYRQYLISYTKDNKSGDEVIDVSDYMASNQTQNYGPQKNIAGIDHTLMGVTRYYESPDSSCLRAERYLGTDLNKPLYAVNFDNNHHSAGTLASNFYFYDLFGP